MRRGIACRVEVDDDLGQRVDAVVETMPHLLAESVRTRKRGIGR